MENVDLSCRNRLCYLENVESDEKLRNLCAQVGVEKGLPKESDLYIADQFGHIKKRLTQSKLYIGEAAVSPDFKKVVFSKETEDDYELFQMDVNGGNMSQVNTYVGKCIDNF
jgi:Tol biopolymer transport system component